MGYNYNYYYYHSLGHTADDINPALSIIRNIPEFP